MQCKKCGTEIKDECLFCHNCGEEVQIVPDYEPELEDLHIDFDKEEVKTEQKPKEKEKTEEKAAETVSNKNAKSRGWIFFLILFLVSVAAFFIAYLSVLKHQEPGAMLENTIPQETKEPLRVSEPEFSLPGGEYGYYISVGITTDSVGTIYYTLDGTMPDEMSKIYREPVKLSEGITVIRAFVMDDNGNSSEIVSEVYRVEFGIPDPPVIIPASGIYTGEQYIRVIVPDGYLAYYTLDGTEPTDASELYTGEFLMPEGETTVRMILIGGNGKRSEISTVVYQCSGI